MMSTRSSYSESNNDSWIAETENDGHDSFDRVQGESKNLIFRLFIFFFKNSLRTIIFFFMIALLTAVGFNPSWARAASKFFSALVVGDLIEAGKAAGEVDLSDNNHQSLRDLAREAGFVTTGRHPFLKQLEIDTKTTFWSKKFAYIGHGLALTRTPILTEDASDNDCAEDICKDIVTYVSKVEADDICAKFKARVPDYKELSTALRNKVISLHLNKFSDYPEWTNTQDKDGGDEFKILYKDEKVKLLEDPNNEIIVDEGQPTYLDDDESYYNLSFRCVIDVKIVAIQE